MLHDSIVDGPGLRYVVFTQGCRHACPGCHNPETHDPEGGVLMSVEDIWRDMRRNPLLQGLTLSGGEPFDQAGPLSVLAQKAADAGLSVWIFTGYDWQALAGRARYERLLRCADVVVDGQYMLARRTLSLAWRGSDNQRLIDARRSLAEGHVALWST